MLQSGCLVIPKALSVDRGSRHYSPAAYELGPRLAIFIDGRPAKDVVTYDTVGGYIIRHKRACDGKRMISGDGRTLLTEVVRGKVEVEPRA